MKKTSHIFALLLGMAGFICPPLWAEASWDGKTISTITSDGLDPSEAATLASELGLGPGKLLDMDHLDGALKEVGALGKWTKVMVEGAVEGSRVQIHLRGARVRRLRNLGFSEMLPDVLEEVKRKGRKDAEQTADLESFAELRQELRDAYRDRGYGSAEVQFETNKIGTDEADVDVKVIAGPPTKIRKIILRGAPEEHYDDLLDRIPLRPGDLVSKAKLATGVEEINNYLRANQYSTSRVTDTSFLYSSDNLLVDISVILKMGERFEIHFVGNSVLDDVQLKAILTDDVLAQADPSGRIVQMIESKYRSLGYPDVSVQVKKTIVDNGKLTLIEMIIKEGERVTISSLRFSSADELHGIDLEELFYELAPGVIKRHLYWAEGIPEATKGMQAYLFSKGYLSTRIAEPKVTFRDDRRAVSLFFDIDIGAQTILSSVELTGIQGFSHSELEKQFAFKVGDPLNKEQIGETGRRILKYYADHGYPKTKILTTPEASLRISPDGQTAVVHMEIEEGPKYKIGNISIDGLKKTRTLVVLREMEIKSGDVYSAKKIHQSEENINLVGLFKRVEVTETPNAVTPGLMDLRISMNEARPGAGEMGIGSYYEEPRLRIRSFVGVAYRNVSGLNQTASSRGELSVPFSRINNAVTVPFLEYALMLGYRVPYPWGMPFAFATQVGFDRVEVSPDEMTLLTRARVEVRLEKRLTAHLRGVYRLLRVEHTTTQNLQPFATDPVGTTPYTERIGSTGPGFILDYRDDIFNPTRGSYHSLDIEFATPVLLSQPTISFVMALYRNSLYLPIIPGVMKLALSLGLGYAHSLATLPGGGPSSIARARLVNELAIGGQGSIRGIFPRSLVSPFLPAYPDQPGTSDEVFYNARAELTTKIVGDLGFAVFCDVGRIWANWVAIPVGYGSEYGVGIGLRYKTPVGPVVIDVAQGYAPVMGNVRFYFTVGSI